MPKNKIYQEPKRKKKVTPSLDFMTPKACKRESKNKKNAETEEREGNCPLSAAVGGNVEAPLFALAAVPTQPCDPLAKRSGHPRLPAHDPCFPYPILF